jgi:hypothetical protein
MKCCNETYGLKANHHETNIYIYNQAYHLRNLIQKLKARIVA